MGSGFKLSLVVPMYNEEQMVEIFCARVIPVLEKLTPDYEIIFVNDGSNDGTLPLLLRQHEKNPRLKIVDLTRNFGKDIALSAGIDFTSGDAVIPFDADLQDPPEAIPDLVTAWQQGSKVVLAVRADRSRDSMLKRLTAKLYYRFARQISEVPIPEDAGDFRLLDQRVVAALRRFPERTRFMKGLFSWLGYEPAIVEYRRAPRAAGDSKWRPWRLWNFALDGLFSFSTVPLRIWTYLGFIVAVCAGGYAVFIVTNVLLTGIDAPGYASTLVFLLLFSGLNMIGLGILGEYIGRIFQEVKRRPLYLVDSTVGFGAGLDSVEASTSPEPMAARSEP